MNPILKSSLQLLMHMSHIQCKEVKWRPYLLEIYFKIKTENSHNLKAIY